MKYGILGSGSANPKVVQDGLADIIADDPDPVFVVHARRAPQGAVGTVYDFIVDNQCVFHVVHRIDDRAPKVLLEESVVDQTYDDPARYIVSVSDVILLLWDEENEESSQKLALMAEENGKPVKDLTMALTPIEFSSKDEEVASIKVGTEEDYAVVGFSRDELLNMTIGILRRQAKQLGIEKPGNTKAEIVDAILSHRGEQVTPVLPDTSRYGQGQLTWIEDDELRSVMIGESFVKRFLEDLRYKPD